MRDDGCGETNEGYASYMRSPEWKERRQAAFNKWGRSCNLCGAKKDLEVHHRTYERFGRESVEDLQVLCWTCHPGADRKRKEQLREKQEWPIMEAWARETFGPTWWDVCDGRDMLARWRKETGRPGPLWVDIPREYGPDCVECGGRRDALARGANSKKCSACSFASGEMMDGDCPSEAA